MRTAKRLRVYRDVNREVSYGTSLAFGYFGAVKWVTDWRILAESPRISVWFRKLRSSVRSGAFMSAVNGYLNFWRLICGAARRG